MQLVVITTHYPYTHLEGYFHQELDFLAKRFETIHILCLETKDFSYQRQVPSNVILHVLPSIPAITYLPKASLQYAKRTRSGQIAKEREIYGSKNRKNEFKLHAAYERDAMRVVKWLEKNKERYALEKDCIFYSYWLSWGAYALTKIRAKGLDALFIARAHAYDADFRRSYQPYRQEIAENVDAIYFISSRLKEAFSTVMQAKAKLHFSPLGTLKLGENQKEIEIALKQNRAEEEPISLLSVGSAVKIKRLDLVVEGLRALAEKRIACRWTHCGGGSEETTLLEQIKTLDSKYIEVVWKGQVANEKLHSLYEEEHFDLFLNSSDREGVPVAIMEALSYGVPAIGRDVGGMREIIRDGRSGYLLAEEASSKALAKAICHWHAQTKEAKQALRQSAYEFWQEEYNAEKVYPAFIDSIIDEKERKLAR